MAKPRFSKNQLEHALREAAGVKSDAAKILGCHRNTIENYIDKYPELEDVVDEERESFTDTAEKMLRKKIEDGDTQSLLFYLRTQGRRRGYNESMNLRNEALPNRILAQALDEMMEPFELDLFGKQKKAAARIVQKYGFQEIFEQLEDRRPYLLDDSGEEEIDESYDETEADKKAS